MSVNRIGINVANGTDERIKVMKSNVACVSSTKKRLF